MHGRAHLFFVTAAIAHALLVRPAHAQPRAADTVRLEVTRDDRSTSCPDGERVRALLLARIDRDAVTPDAARLASLRFTHTASRFEALLRITGPGPRATSRRLRSSATDCGRLGDAAVLVLALAIDPLRALRRQSPIAAAVTPAAAPVAPALVAPAPVAPAPVAPVPAPGPPPVVAPPPVVPPPVVASVSRPATAWQLGALATMSYGVAPGLVADALRPGLALRVSMIRGRVMVPVELGLDAPGRFEDPRSDAAVWSLPLSVGVGVCPRFGARVVLFACATISAGAVFAWGDGYTNDRGDVAFSASVGGRAGVEAPISARWRFVASLDARGLVLRPVFEVGGAAGGTLWAAPILAASLAVGVAWHNL